MEAQAARRRTVDRDDLALVLPGADRDDALGLPIEKCQVGPQDPPGHVPIKSDHRPNLTLLAFLLLTSGWGTP
jgi:hypothetical protein